MKSKTSTVIDDIPWKIVNTFAFFLSFHLEDVFNRLVTHSEYANIWKFEIVTPVPIHTQLDINNQNEAYAGIISMLDWSKAFDRQCPKLGV